jgi:HTH-type transcriptional regulator/antitoxin HigA
MPTELQSTGTAPADDIYLDLVRAFPLRPIRSADEHDRAMIILDSLDDRRANLRTEEQDYFLVLALLVERYEDEIYPSREEAESR